MYTQIRTFFITIFHESLSLFKLPQPKHDNGGSSYGSFPVSVKMGACYAGCYDRILWQETPRYRCQWLFRYGVKVPAELSFLSGRVFVIWGLDTYNVWEAAAINWGIVGLRHRQNSSVWLFSITATQCVCWSNVAMRWKMPLICLSLKASALVCFCSYSFRLERPVALSFSASIDCFQLRTIFNALLQQMSQQQKVTELNFSGNKRTLANKTQNNPQSKLLIPHSTVMRLHYILELVPIVCPWTVRQMYQHTDL